MGWAEPFSWLISAVVALSLAAFVLYLVGLSALPVNRRPRTPIYDRLGRRIDEMEDRTFRESRDEDDGGESGVT